MFKVIGLCGLIGMATIMGAAAFFFKDYPYAFGYAFCLAYGFLMLGGK